MLEQTVGDPVVLVGHSLGAMVAAIAASRVPERVRGLVLEDPPMQTMGRSIQGTVWQKLFEGMRQVCVAGGSLEQMTQRLGSIPLPQADFGAGGALSDAEAQAFCQGCQECEWVRFPGKNHSLHGTIPGQIAIVIDRFLAKP